MRLQGKISEWNDARGFGFVQPNGGGERCFVHIRAFAARDRRPVLGDVITYDVENDAQGRRNAVAVRFALRRGGARMGPITTEDAGNWIPRRTIAVVFIVGLTALCVWRKWPMWLPAVYVFTSALTFLRYWNDKAAAQRDARRTPEKTLQLLALFGGWPGALWAQHSARHKNRKASFQREFWVVVVINLGTLALLLHQIPR
jgi:uncharacterized membrane protein YsdA (DUF1294 family)/cold shock CspA family protein